MPVVEGTFTGPVEELYPLIPQQLTAARAELVFPTDGQWSQYFAEVDAWRYSIVDAEVEAVLWKSREGIWGSAPSLSSIVPKLMELYFTEERKVDMNDDPAPSWLELAGIVLAHGGSAPGRNNEPYEAYHMGVRFVTAC